MIWILRVALALFFTRAGQLHLTDPRPWEAIVPPPLPANACVLLSGVFEILGGIGAEAQVLAGRYENLREGAKAEVQVAGSKTTPSKAGDEKKAG